jgi:caffeoyl-CoA O-methyltransferase
VSDLVRPDVEAYAEAHSSPMDEHLERNLAEARAALPYPSMLSGAVVGRLLQAFVFAVQARLVVEIGTYSGYSALAMAEALAPGGRVVTLELADEHADFAQRSVDASPYADVVEIRRGPALESLDALDGPYDFVFIDADKTGYPAYYEAALAKLSDHGLIVFDNTLRGGTVLDPSADDEASAVMAQLNDRLAHDERVVAVQLTVRDGLTVVRRRLP